MFLQKSNCQTPLLTIVIPTYKRAALLKETLDSCRSILNEAPGRVDVLIVDNESESANTKTATVELILECYPEFSYWVNSTNLGMFGNWNQGIELAKTEWITVLHDDDLVCSGFLKDALSILEKSDCNLLCFPPDILDQRSIKPGLLSRLQQKNRKTEERDYSHDPINYIFGNIHYGTLGLFFKKSLAQELGCFDVNYFPSADYKFFGEYAIKFGGVLVHQTLLPRCLYRIAENETLKEETWRGFIKQSKELVLHFGHLYGFSRIGRFFVELYATIYYKFQFVRMPQRFNVGRQGVYGFLGFLTVLYLKTILFFLRSLIRIFKK